MSRFNTPLGIRMWPEGRALLENQPTNGYTFAPLENCAGAWRFSALAQTDQVEGMMRAFASCLPEEAFFILECYQEPVEPARDPEPKIFYSPYMPVEEIFDAITPYLPQLIHDGFVGFGLANNRCGAEFFYSEEKFFSCFTGNHIRMMDLFAHYGLAHCPDLLFPTNFGHDHLSLLCHDRQSLPEPFASMSDRQLDYSVFCQELIEGLEMYPVEEDLSFFLSEREQDHIEQLLTNHPEYADFAEEDFGSLLLDWADFVNECGTGFDGNLTDYCQGLMIRDLIQYVIDTAPGDLGPKVQEIIADADQDFKTVLIDRRKRLDPPDSPIFAANRFWYQGVVAKQGVELRRDLIRHGWFTP